MTYCEGCQKDVKKITRGCRVCHARYMREWRREHRLTPEQRLKDNARSYAGVYKRRGKLEPEPCEDCGATENIQMHHDDYSKPLDVRWKCEPDHRTFHGAHVDNSENKGG